MNSLQKYVILIICAVIPIIGNCQKTIKRNSKPVKEKSIFSKKTNRTKLKQASKVGKNSEQSSFVVVKYKKNDLVKHILSNMIDICGGSFLMGSNNEKALSWEKPVHSETVNSFKIGKYEVSQEEWISIMDENPSYYIGKDLPVQGVSLDECLEFIRRLNTLSGLEFRLPSEAEWEYAAKGGKDGHVYDFSGSDDIEEVGWYQENCESKIHAIGQKKPNELGIYDMSGNVWEWTSDKFSKDYNSPRKDQYYILRGGSWIQEQNDCRVSTRYWASPQNSGLSFGFRLALDKKQDPENETSQVQ